MRGMNGVSFILSAFLCGFNLPELTWRIDSDAGIHSATDLYVWMIVPMTGIWAIYGAWRAFKGPSSPPTAV